MPIRNNAARGQASRPRGHISGSWEKATRYLAFLIVAIGFTLTLASIGLAATVTVDCSQEQGSFPHYNKFASHIRCAGAASTALMKEVCQGGLIRTFYALDDAVVISPGNYNWNAASDGGEGTGVIDPLTPYWEADPVVDNIIAMGAQPVLCIDFKPTKGKAPKWLGTWPTKSGDWSTFDRVIGDWLAHIKSRYPQCHYVEVFNEPAFDGITQSDICAVYHHVALAVQKANSAGAHFKVGGAAETLGAQVPGETALVEYAAKNNLPLDFISWHCYNDVSGGAPSGARDLAMRLQAMLNSHHKGNIPQLITEWNCTTWDRGKSAEVFANQGAWLAAGRYGCMETGLGENLIPMPFCINSYVGDYQSIVAPTGKGYADGKVFPEYNVYKMMAMQRATRIKASSDDGNTYPMASVGSDASVALMVARPTNSSLRVKVTVTELPSPFKSGAFSLTRYLVDETHSNFMFDSANDKLQQIGSKNVAAGSNFSTTVALGGNAVILFVLAPSGTAATPQPASADKAMTESDRGGD